jgi:hypothetical protein
MASSIQEFFPFNPIGSDWESWNGNLVMWYTQEAVGYHPENDWKLTAHNVAQSATFSAYPVPDPEKYDKWQDWAYEFTQIINGPSH